MLLVRAEGLVAAYDKKEVLHGVSLFIDANEIVALIGHNGAGKTTTFRAILGIKKIQRGNVIYQGEDISNRSPAHNVKAGICFVPQEKAVFKNLTVSENLEVASLLRGRVSLSELIKTIFDLFPVLEVRHTQKAGTLSGGEQRMLAFAISLMLAPKVLLLDEPSLGLAPVLALDVIKTIKEVNRRLNVAIILAEQNIPEAALRISDRAYVIRAGRNECESKSSELLQTKRLWELF